MRPGLTIGEFAQVTHLSVRTLRRYHERGLLEPAVVDPDSGYRYYTSDQIPVAQVIRRLRELDMPLREVREVLATPDPGARASLVAAHLGRLESELDNVRAAIDWSLENRDVLSALRLAGSLRVFWFRRHPGEAIQRVGEILALPEAAARSTARAWALSGYGLLVLAYFGSKWVLEEVLHRQWT